MLKTTWVVYGETPDNQVHWVAVPEKHLQESVDHFSNPDEYVRVFTAQHTLKLDTDIEPVWQR